MSSKKRKKNDKIITKTKHGDKEKTTESPSFHQVTKVGDTEIEHEIKHGKLESSVRSYKKNPKRHVLAEISHRMNPSHKIKNLTIFVYEDRPELCYIAIGKEYIYCNRLDKRKLRNEFKNLLKYDSNQRAFYNRLRMGRHPKRGRPKKEKVKDGKAQD